MSKQIIIIGGGISGLSILHNLKKKYADRTDVQIRLLERNAYAGGTIQSYHRNGTTFEMGPSGFLDSKESTLNLVEDLGLKNELITASPESRFRYLAVDNRLHALPVDPLSFLQFQPLSLWGKLRTAGEFFIPKGGDPSETVYDFGKRRLGEEFVECFLDPMVSGIWGGDARKIHLHSAFPRIVELEREYGSLFKAMVQLRKEKSWVSGQPGGQLRSFQKGMGQLVAALFDRYRDSIQLGENVTTVQRQGAGFVVDTQAVKYFADHLFVCAPAYGAAEILHSMNPGLTQLLQRIPYAPIIVAGLVYRKTAFKKLPGGFGYLVPSSEGKEVLGVVFSSQVFPNRTSEEHVLFQVMLGGDRNRNILTKSEAQLTALAQEEIEIVLGASERPGGQLLKVIPRAIPQYYQEYPELRRQIAGEVNRCANLYLAANYLDGVSLNDCTQNARKIVETISA